MRARTRSSLLPHSPRLRLLGFASAIAIAMPLAAQDNPRTFSLPEPTPTPTPAPQGPVDIRNGVVIGPRTIPAEPPASEPASSVATQPAPSPTPSPAPTPSTGNTAVSNPVVQPTQPASQPPRSAPTPTPSRTEVAPTSAETGDAPGDDTQPDQTNEPSVQPGFSEDGFYSDNDNGEASAPDMSNEASPVAGAPDTGTSHAISDWLGYIAAGLALLASLIAIAWWIMRRRKKEQQAPKLLPPPTLTAGVRQSIAEASKGAGAFAPSEHSDKPAKFAAKEPTPVPLRAEHQALASKIDLQLEVTSGSRSLRLFMLTYRISIANRSDRALRDLSIESQLVCARRSETNQDGRPLELVERIGPHQSRVVTGEAQLPLSDVTPIRQGQTPLFIPLLKLSLSQSGGPTQHYRFVIGSPSTTGSTRLHPIPLDTPPGSIPNLRAQEIKEAISRQPA